jgi:hypothetical protein
MPSGSATFGQIVCTQEPRGKFQGAIADGTLYPGTVVEVKAATVPVNGQFTFGAAVANFGCIAIVCEDWNQGKTVDSPYASGENMKIYFPLPGDDLLLRCINATYAIGDIIGIGSGGLGTISTGTTGVQPFQSYDSATIGGGPYLVLVKYSGH